MQKNMLLLVSKTIKNRYLPLKFSKFKTQLTQQENNNAQNDNKPRCPKCGSTNIQIVPRKWSLLTGFLTNKTDRVCVNCKHKF